MTETILYNTKTFCPRCTILERKGLLLRDAVVVSRDDKVYLKTLCDQHTDNRTNETLYCSSLSFFQRMMNFDGTYMKTLKDIEDLTTNIPTKPTPSNFTIELNIHLPNSTFLSDQEIKDNLLQFQSYYPKNKKFVLKVSAKGSNDIETINEKAKMISNQLKGYPILLEVTVERLNEIAKLNDSAFLMGKIYPALKYYLKRGDEELFIKDIQRLLTLLRQFSDIQSAVTIVVERKFANLSSILSLLRQNNDVIRFIILSIERPPKELVSSLQAKYNNNTVDQQQGNNNDNEDDDKIINFSDPYELIQEIQVATEGQIKDEDFYPLSTASVLEPMFNLMGYGLYNIRPSPYCAFATCLLNTESLKSVPINRLFNITKLYKELLPILPSIEEKIGFFNGLKIKSILKNCNIPGVTIPNIFDYLTDKSKSHITKRVIDQTQILIIHNNMDIAALDLKRRCHCSVETKHRDGFVSSCTNCI
ncbi:hypothetical protein DLAC_07532 [Tieghemostelium lacteum]|uniref:Uncharacterized protein n=1 Tax=Tieghemostelium lacteum TaxID=361077 RepID=A0A151ZCS1_TIELA|nr:hypothetical protein DLAC_07532 [Tieghemostelium lacteum]|eukprot:KYQ91746.1 hypothetical protein DLAC_07532 [Tieghemostelium lacteum]